MTLSDIISVEIEIRELLERHGFKNKSDYYRARQEVYRDLPKDLHLEIEGYEVTYGEEEHFERRATMAELSKPITRPKLVIKRKQEEK